MQHPLLDLSQLDVENSTKFLAPRDLNTTTLSMRFMNSGVNLRRAASNAGLVTFSFCFRI